MSNQDTRQVEMNIPHEGGVSIPEFKGALSLKNVQDFKLRWEQYLRRVEEYNNGQLAAKKIKRRTLLSVVDQDSRTIIAEFYAGCAVEELTDELVNDAFTAVCAKYQGDKLRSLDPVFSGFAMKLEIADPIERVSDYLLRFTRMVRINLLEEEMKDRDTFKNIVHDYLIPGTKPETLRLRMAQVIKRDAAVKQEKIAFFKALEEQAVLDRQAYDISKRVASSSGSSGLSSSYGKKSERRAQKESFNKYTVFDGFMYSPKCLKNGGGGIQYNGSSDLGGNGWSWPPENHKWPEIACLRTNRCWKAFEGGL
jgi:hypothetical protein